MGVPGFFLWLLKNYKKDSFVFVKEKLLVKSDKSNKMDEVKKQKLIDDLNNIDYFLIDANCLIHPMCFKILAENADFTNQDILEDKMINKVLEYIQELIDYVKPTQGVFLAIDGVAPVAKMKQQKSRRFKSVHDKELYDKIRLKNNKPIPKYWNNSAITPGTLFMEKLHNKIMGWCKKQELKIIYSSCNTPSEGEHKLLQFIRNNENKDLKYVLYGLDADLIFLALSTNNDNIFLLREANQISRQENEDTLNIVSIKIMKDCIQQSMTTYYQKQFIDDVKAPELLKNNLTSDFIFLCYFLGNDFLPHLPSLNIHKNGIEYLIEAYMEVFFELQTDKFRYLLTISETNKIKIDNEFLIKLVGKLAENEEAILRENFAMHKRFSKCESQDSYDKEIFRIENLQFKIDDPIKLGSDNHASWRKRYYNHYFGCETDESVDKFAQKMVENYIIGINWVTQYYFDKCPAWDWYFPYDHPPFLSDIKNYIKDIDINKIKFAESKPLKPFVQLLCILPQQSNYLLPLKLKNLMSNPKSSLSHLYPLDFQQDYLNKHKYWMAIPTLPNLEIDLVKYIYNKYQDTLSKEDEFRNRLCDDYTFNL